jgi:DNA-binding transcriptional MerR regulator
MNAESNRTWDSSAVIRLTKGKLDRSLTLRQLQYWDRTGLLSVRTRERKGLRLYTYEEILRLRIIVSLMEARLPVQRIRAAISNIEKLAARSGKPWHALKVITDGNSVFVLDGDTAIDALRNQTLNLVLLGALQKDIREACRRHPAKRAPLLAKKVARAASR